jgi:hypothetical protein
MRRLFRGDVLTVEVLFLRHSDLDRLPKGWNLLSEFCSV